MKKANRGRNLTAYLIGQRLGSDYCETGSATCETGSAMIVGIAFLDRQATTDLGQPVFGGLTTAVDFGLDIRRVAEAAMPRCGRCCAC